MTQKCEDFCSSEFGVQYPQSVVYKRKTMKKEHLGQLSPRKGKVFCKGSSTVFSSKNLESLVSPVIDNLTHNTWSVCFF